LLTTEGIQQSYTINEIVSKSILRVALFPNPTSNLVYFKVENLNYKNLSYRLYDINGRLITSGKILNDQSVVSLQNFPSNIFIVKVFRGELEEQSFKIFKAN
jgi:predicted CoA-binding protein